MRDCSKSAKLHEVARTDVVIGPNQVMAASPPRRGKMIKLPMRCGCYHKPADPQVIVVDYDSFAVNYIKCSTTRVYRWLTVEGCPLIDE